jgi:hypothetical protein
MIYSCHAQQHTLGTYAAQGYYLSLGHMPMYCSNSAMHTVSKTLKQSPQKSYNASITCVQCKQMQPLTLALQTDLCSSQLTAATFATALSDSATFFHLGASCWQWPHQGA